MKSVQNLFNSYKKHSTFYDEMFSQNNETYPFTQEFVKDFNQLSLQDIKKADKLTNQFFLNEGITFNVYGDRQSAEGSTFPMDVIPRNHEF